MSNELLELLMQMPWQGNVRELENTIERMTILCNHEKIGLEDLPRNNTIPTPTPQSIDQQLIHDFPTLKELERRYVAFINAQTKGDKMQAAKILGKNWRTIYRKLQNDTETVPKLEQIPQNHAFQSPLFAIPKPLQC